MKGFVHQALNSILLIAASALAAVNVLAIEPANIQAGPVYIAPRLDIEVRHVDNLFRTSDEEVSTWISEITPGVQAWLQNGASTYSLNYKLNDSTYASSHADDYTDHTVNLDIHHEFTAKNVFNINGEYYDGHEDRGTGLSEGLSGLIDSPVEYERTFLGGDYTYGNRESRGRMTLAAETVDYEFQNFRNATQFRDYEQDTYSGIFYWKVGSNTDLLLQARAIDTVYDMTDRSNRGGSYDSDELNYLVGVSWGASAKTGGSIKLGRYDRSYDSPARKDEDGFQWEVELRYMPRTYSSIDLSTRRYSQETNGLGDFINTQEYKADWNHDWSKRSSTRIGVLFAKNDYSGSIRSDDTTDAVASYTYKVKRWFDVGAGYRYENRDSALRSLNYKQNTYFISAELSL